MYITSDHQERKSYRRSHSKNNAVNSQVNGNKKPQNWRASPDKSEETDMATR